MRECYFKKLDSIHMTSIDVSAHFTPNTYVVNRVITPVGFRGQGHARECFKKLLADADTEGVVLVLDINPYGDMNFEQLEDWYGRLGFKPNLNQGYYERKPKCPCQDQACTWKSDISGQTVTD